MPAKRSLEKVRFNGQEPIGHSPREPTQGNTGTPGDTVQVVVQTPSLVDGSRDKRRNSPKAKIEKSVKDNETDIVTTIIERPGQPETRAANSDAEFHKRYVEVKSLAWTWVQKYFTDITPEAKKSLNLLHLAHTSPQLMEYANWISCCGQKRTWEGVFNEQRAMLVYGILGKMLEVHVFGHEMFGGDRNQLRALRELDIELVNGDGTSFLPYPHVPLNVRILICSPGFYRQRCRAQKILAWLPNPNTQPPNFHHSLTTLHASFMELLSPLLPISPPRELQPQLLAILIKAATLSLSMRRDRNVVYHWETHPAVGTLFEERSMHILNVDEHDEEDDYRRNTDLEVVTMAGWPSCVAYRPNADDSQKGKKKNGQKARLGVHRIGKAEVCVTFGPVVKPLSVEPKNWLGKRLRVEMTERHELRNKTAAVKRNVAGLGVAVTAMMGLEYAVSNPWILKKAKGYLGSFV